MRNSTYSEENVRAQAQSEAMRTTRSLQAFLYELEQGNDEIRFTLPHSLPRGFWKAVRTIIEYIERTIGMTFTVPARFEANWEVLLSHLQKSGLVRELRLLPPGAKDPPLFYFDIDTIFRHGESDGLTPLHTRFSRGVSMSYDEAISKAFGECLERVPFLEYRDADMTRASIRHMREAGLSFLNPKSVGHFSDAQKKKRPELAFRHDDLIFRWVPGRRLPTNEVVYIPAQLVYRNYARAQDTFFEPLLQESSTHGTGAYFSTEGAILSGLYECIQRDAFFRYWLAGKAPRKIALKDVREDTAALLSSLERLGMEVTFLDTTSDIRVPAITCCITCTEKDRPYVSLGSSCEADVSKALHRSLVEACSMYQWTARQKELFSLPGEYVPFSDPDMNAYKRVLLWANHDMRRHFEFFLQGTEIPLEELFSKSRTFNTVSEELRWVVEQVTHGPQGPVSPIYYVEASNKTLQNVGFHAVKVLAPDLFPLYYNERNAPLAHPRIQDIANTIPHPFP